MYRKLIKIFLVSFLLNYAWENLQLPLYVSSKPGLIFHTEARWILAATFSDAIFITILALIFIKIPYLQKRPWYALVIGIITAIFVEIFALQTGQWAYSELMPLVPVFKTGLSPTIQLGLTAYLVFMIFLKT